MMTNAEMLNRCIAAIEAMPGAAGSTARPGGLTHCCDGCGKWMTASAVRLNTITITWWYEHCRGRMKCGPVHDLSPVEGVLRSDVIATLRRVMEDGT